jgi:hypothetical protein
MTNIEKALMELHEINESLASIAHSLENQNDTTIAVSTNVNANDIVKQISERLSSIKSSI